MTQSRENVRLGLVNVASYPEEVILSHVQKKQALAQAKLVGFPERLASEREAVRRAELEYAEARRRLARMEDDYLAGRIGTDTWMSRGSILPNAEARLIRTRRALAARVAAESTYYVSDEFYFAGLPEPTATAQTDADGRFSMKIPGKGRYALAATAQRMVFGSAESYFWMVWITEEAVERGTLLLSNDNLTTAASPTSVRAAGH